MKITEINQNTRPDLFFMPDDNGDHTNSASDTSDDNTDCLKSLRRKVHNGEAEFKMYSDHIEIEYNSVVVAKAELIGSIFINDSWVQRTFNFENAEITKIGDGEFRAIITTQNVIFGLKWSMAHGIKTKQTFYFDSPERLVRIRWHVETFDSALATNTPDDKGLKYGVEDYEGNVDYSTTVHETEGWTNHYWDFEPTGHLCEPIDSRTPIERYQQSAGLKVDPYLQIDEQATYVDVTCDGYDIRISESDNFGAAFLRLYGAGDVGGTVLVHLGSQLRDNASVLYYMGRNTNRVITVVESQLTYIVIEVEGNLYSGAGTWLGGSESAITFIHRFTIYSDRLAWSCKASCGGSSIIIEANTTNALFYLADAQSSNNDIWAESSGSEIDAGFSYYDTANYLVFLADEINVQGINLYNDGIGSFKQRAENTAAFYITWNNGTFAANTDYEMVCEYIFDSAEREYGSQLYTSTERLEQGEQYKDQALALTDGTVVTSVPGLTAIGSDGFFSDGAWHWEGDANEGPVEVNYDITRHNPKIVYEQTAAGPVPTLEVNDSPVTLHDPDAAAYDSTRYYVEDIAGNGSQWLITMPADSEVTSSDTWAINPVSGVILSPIYYNTLMQGER